MSLQFDYFYGSEAEQFSFYRIPKILFKDKMFKDVSTDAKVLYGYYFVCIAEREIFSYVSEFKDLLSFENRDRLYPFSVNLGYSSFNPKKHKTIDDLVLDCDKKLMEHKPKIQIY